MYYKIENYSMKCRLYLNNEQKQKVDNILIGLRLAHNCALYDCVTNGVNQREYIFQDENGKECILHYFDSRAMSKADYLKKLKSDHPIIAEVPASALSGANGLFLNDVAKKFVDTENKKNVSVESAISNKKLHYYSKKHPRQSYTYQIPVTALSSCENPKVFYCNLTRVGKVKVRGWNQNIRFTEQHDLDFLQYIECLKRQNPKERTKKAITATIKRDNCNDYWIIFKLSDVYIDKKEPSGKEIGIDVGIKNAIITSEGAIYENPKLKQAYQDYMSTLCKQLSRREGWANSDFRKKYKASGGTLKPSKSYLETQQKISELHRLIARKRDLLHNEQSVEIVENASFIAVESLNVKDMSAKTGILYKEGANGELEPDNKKMRSKKKLRYQISDAAMYDILNKISYKANWYQREIKKIGRYVSSSKECHVCHYINSEMTLSIREWTCPMCGTHHDRDVNAAINILNHALQN